MRWRGVVLGEAVGVDLRANSTSAPKGGRRLEGEPVSGARSSAEWEPPVP